jgi:hypothetical protein
LMMDNVNIIIYPSSIRGRPTPSTGRRGRPRSHRLKDALWITSPSASTTSPRRSRD